MWVQLHDVPLGMMNRVYDVDLGKTIGEVIDLDVNKDGIGWGSYLRIRVWVNLLIPLICGKLISFWGNQSWISFKYERLPNFYFRCGAIKHPFTGCGKGNINNKLHVEETPQYGSWIRASLIKFSTKPSPAFSGKNCHSGTSSFNRRDLVYQK